MATHIFLEVAPRIPGEMIPILTVADLQMGSFNHQPGYIPWTIQKILPLLLGIWPLFWRVMVPSKKSGRPLGSMGFYFYLLGKCMIPKRVDMKKLLYVWELILNRRKRKGWYLHCVLRSNLGKQICYQFLRFPTRKLIVCKCAMNVIGCFFTPSRIPAKPSRKQTMPQPRPHLRLCGSKLFFRNLWEGLQVPMKGEDVSMSGRCGHRRGRCGMWPWRCGNSRHGWKQKLFAETFRVGHPSMTRGLARNPAGCPSLADWGLQLLVLHQACSSVSLTGSAATAEQETGIWDCRRKKTRVESSWWFFCVSVKVWD